ncbi:MAG: response regulator [Lachnospiraceae bacterium]|nr:response regulator [Lachnospiraceae bacterium]
MAVSRILIESVLFAILLITVSIVYKHKALSKDDEGSRRFFMLVNAYVAGVICYIIIYLMDDSFGAFRHMFYIIVWYSYAAVLACMIVQSLYIFDYKGRTLKHVTSALCYYALFVVLIELFFHKFRFESNPTGIEFYPYAVPRFFYYATPIILYCSCTIYLLGFYRGSHNKIRERHLLKLGVAAMIPSFIGITLESIFHVFFEIRYPVFFISMIVPVGIMSDLNLKSRSFRLYREDFEEFLREDNTDAVFICDDELNVLYENKAADINSVLYKDRYIGKKLTDIFVIENDVKRALFSKDARDGLMVPALYPVTERKLVMSVEYIYDCCDEILCSIITVPNYKVAMNEEDFTREASNDSALVVSPPSEAAGNTDKDDIPGPGDIKIIDPNTNILLVDEDVDNLDSCEKQFEPYNITVNRAVGGRMALDMILDRCYDAIFIRSSMEKLNGIETAKRIRGMEDSYYAEVPIIFVLSEPVVNVYKDLLEVSFNDFIEMPITFRKLNGIMTRWLWRRYAITDKSAGTSQSTRVVRTMDALNDLYEDCKILGRDGMYRQIGYCLKGMKRLSARLDNKHLIDSCDKLVEIYIRGQYDRLDTGLEDFRSELERLKNSSSFGMIY